MTERRAVEVGAVPADDDELDALLIHEVAHATASPYHGAKWRTRLLAAARQARSVGRDNLVDLLEQDVRAYQDGAAFPKSAVYASAADAVAMNPGATFAQVTRFVAEQTGLRVGEVAAEFPRLRRVFDEARAG